MNSDPLRFAAVNFEASFGQVKENLANMESWIKQLTQQGAQVIAFPEMSLTGFDRTEAITPHLQTVPGPSTDRLLHIAAAYNVLILAGLPTVTQAKQRFITHLAISPDGIIGSYHKLHLSPNEAAYYTAGQEVTVIEYKNWKIGIQLCYDTHFPELSTVQALAGVDILFMGFASPRENAAEKCDRLMRYLPARAYDNSCYLISCNLAGRGANGQTYPGGGCAITPKGQLIDSAHTPNKTHLLIEMSKDTLSSIRSKPKAHFLSQRKPEIYKGLHHVPD